MVFSVFAILELVAANSLEKNRVVYGYPRYNTGYYIVNSGYDRAFNDDTGYKSLNDDTAVESTVIPVEPTVEPTSEATKPTNRNQPKIMSTKSLSQLATSALEPKTYQENELKTI